MGKKIKNENNILIPNLGANILYIYEGKTISHSSTNDIEKLKPFKPFAKNSSGNYSILIYNGKEGLGDIIIDCGYTKCFLSMKINETFTYTQNLVCFPMFKYLNEKNELWKPNSLNFNIESKIKYEFQHILYLIDIEENLSSNDIINIKKRILKPFNIGDAVYFIHSKPIIKILSLNDLKNFSDNSITFNKNSLENIKEEIIKDFNENYFNKKYIITDKYSKIDDFKTSNLLFENLNVTYFPFNTKLSDEECDKF